jgi:hypothetical protein
MRMVQGLRRLRAMVDVSREPADGTPSHSGVLRGPA